MVKLLYIKKILHTNFILLKAKIFFYEKKKNNSIKFTIVKFTIIELHTLKILGSVKTFRHVSSPPIVAIIPLFSILNCIVLVASNPAPVVIESPIAAITSISPGLNRFTESGTVGDLPPANVKLSNYETIIKFYVLLFYDSIINLYMNIILTIIRDGNSCMTARDINGITNIIHFR